VYYHFFNKNLKTRRANFSLLFINFLLDFNYQAQIIKPFNRQYLLWCTGEMEGEGERRMGRVGEWRMGRWEEWESERVGEWESGG
jgi:hypothetical protein